MGFCGNCGSSLAADDSFCGECGSSLEAFRTPPDSSTTASETSASNVVGAQETAVITALDTAVATAPETTQQDPDPAMGGELGWWDLAPGGQAAGHQPGSAWGSESTTVIAAGESWAQARHAGDAPDPASRIDDWRSDPAPASNWSELPEPKGVGARPDWAPPVPSPAPPVLDVGSTEADRATARRRRRTLVPVVASVALLAVVGVGAYRALTGEWPAASLISGDVGQTSTPRAVVPSESVPSSVPTSTESVSSSQSSSPQETTSVEASPKAEPGIAIPARDALVDSAVFSHFVVSVTGNRQVDPTRPEAGMDVDLKVCLTSLTDDATKGTTRLSWEPWNATTSLGAQLDPAAPAGDLAGAYPRESRVAPGECRTGTLRFIPPDGAGHVVAVTYANGQGDAHTFEALP